MTDAPDRNDRPNSSHRRELLAFIVFAFAIFQVLGFISYHPDDLSFYTTSPNDPRLNYGGVIGAYLTFAFVFLFGFSSAVSPLFLSSLAWRLLRGIDLWKFQKWFLCYQLSLVSGSVLLGMKPAARLDPWVSRFQVTGPGGLVGTVFGQEVVGAFLGYAGGFFLFAVLWLIALQGVVEFSYFRLIRKVLALARAGIAWCLAAAVAAGRFLWGAFRKAAGVFFAGSDSEGASREKPRRDSRKRKRPEKRPALPEEPVVQKSPPPQASRRRALTRKRSGGWEFPSLELLKEPVKYDLDLEENINANAGKLVETLGEFDIQCDVSGIESGPVITRYEIQIASGIKVQKVTSLDNDIGLAMRAKSVRIIAPIPGKSAIGIEIPNQIRKTVFFKELLSSREFKDAHVEIPLVLGQDISGRAVIADLEKMPHLLIAGATGSGKSVCINSIIVSLLYTLSPSEVKVMMIDPKKVELATYKGLPHLYIPLITNPNKVAMGLRCLIEEMERRYQMFKDVGVRNISAYNKKDKTEARQKAAAAGEEEFDPQDRYPDRLPYIVVVIDELADLMMVAKSEIESSVVRLAQLSRAVGIHMVLATQRPSVDVVTGLIKANIPARIAFRVSSRVDSRTVLDSIGAEKLLGRGDMLFLNPGNIELYRVQGAFLEDEEISGVVDHWTSQGEPEYDGRALHSMNRPEGENAESDSLFDEAVEAIRDSRHASTSFLQKRFRIGYNRASRLIDELESRGVIGPPATGGKTREIYLEEE